MKKHRSVTLLTITLDDEEGQIVAAFENEEDFWDPPFLFSNVTTIQLVEEETGAFRELLPKNIVL